ncbi:uncharacterized protein LOC105830534 [Monomorium pharaonis]|uniref:uncharacterized protein LOC105830534 n=1 Tax=Monomorium pharaonis TaxID=307658 RepID=UPI00174728D2|nr:uncharacterized protein LOC105830534 [Monomorium pharaonis]
MLLFYVLYCRLQAINELTCQLDELSDTPGIALKIRRIREMHSGICDLAIMVNDIYGFHLLFCSVNCLTMIVFQLFTFYTVIIEQNNSSIWMFTMLSTLYIMQFGLICRICTLVRREIDKTGIIIYTIVLNLKHVNLELKGRRSQSNVEVQTLVEGPNIGQNFIWSSTQYLNDVAIRNLHKNLNRDCIRNETNDFLNQLQHRRIVFTACDFFELNNVIFSGFIGVIIVYLTLCIQFYKPVSIIKKT